MKQVFPGWYAREPDVIAAIWDKAIFVPDANVLLHCLRHPSNVRQELLRLLEQIKDSLWIPYQVGLEFHRNRLDVEYAAQDVYQKLIKDYDGIINQAREKLKQLRAHPTIDVEREFNALEMFLGDFTKRMGDAQAAHPSQAIHEAVERLTAILEGCVGEKPTSEFLASIKKEGDDRYTRKIPPGYKDIKKDGDGDKFGDLIIWKAMIEKAKETKRPVVFITDDVKEDWWWIHRGRKLGPRPELVEEFLAATGQAFLIYEFSNFLDKAAERFPGGTDNYRELQKSLTEDERARKHQLDAEERANVVRRSYELEDERESILQILSGTPGVDMDKSQIDRALLRSRVTTLNAEIALLSESIAKEIVTQLSDGDAGK